MAADALLRVIIQALNQGDDTLGELQADLAGSAEQAGTLSDANADLSDSLQTVAGDTGAFAEQMQGAGSDAGAFADELEGVGEQAQDTGDAIDDVGDSADDAADGGSSFKQQMRGLNEALGPLNVGLGIVKGAIGELTDSAERLGRTELQDSFDRVSVSVDRVKDSLLTMNIFGRDSIAWVTDAANGLNNYINMYSALGIAVQQRLGLISDETAKMQAQALVNQVAAASYEAVALTADQLAQAERDQLDPLDETNRLLNDQAVAANTVTPALAGAAGESVNYAAMTRDATQALTDLAAKQDGWASSTGQDVINALNDAGVKGRDYEAALLAVDDTLGTSFANDAEKKQKMDDLVKAYKDGKIGIDDFKSGLAALTEDDMPKNIQALQDAANSATTFHDNLDVIPRDVRVNVHTDYTYNGNPPPGASGGVTGGGQGGQGSGFAAGGISTGPESGHWEQLHGTEAVIPLQGGAVPVQMMGGGGNGEVAALLRELIGLMRQQPQQMGRSLRDALAMRV